MIILYLLHLFLICIYFITFILVHSKTKRISMSSHFQCHDSCFLCFPIKNWLIWILRLSNWKQSYDSIFQIHILRFLKWYLINSISFSFKLYLMNSVFVVKLFIILNIYIVSHSVGTRGLCIHYQIASASNLLSIESFRQYYFVILINILYNDFLFLIHVFKHCKFVFEFFTFVYILLNMNHAS